MDVEKHCLRSLTDQSYPAKHDFSASNLTLDSDQSFSNLAGNTDPVDLEECRQGTLGVLELLSLLRCLVLQ